MPAELLHRFDEGTSRLTELNHARLQVVERSFYETIRFFVVG